MRKPIIAGNWKMNNTQAEAIELINALKPLVADVTKTEIVVCVPYTCIEKVKKAVRGSKIKVGAENVAWADKGAFTGKISANMLKEVGAEYVIIGHSERRQYFGETDKTVNMRTVQALKNDLKPIVCVGETLEEREGGITNKVLDTQLYGAFEGFTQDDIKKVVIAYEPVWAIGTGVTATADQAEEACAFIRKLIAKLYSEEAAEAITIQYGGSMNAKNAAELLSKENVDGGLIGGASLKAPDFAAIVSAASK